MTLYIQDQRRRSPLLFQPCNA